MYLRSWPSCPKQVSRPFLSTSFCSTIWDCSYITGNIGNQWAGPPGSESRRCTQPLGSEPRVSSANGCSYLAKVFLRSIFLQTTGACSRVVADDGDFNFSRASVVLLNIDDASINGSFVVIRASSGRRVVCSRSVVRRASTGAGQRQRLVLRGGNFSVVHRKRRAPGGLVTGDRSDSERLAAGAN